MTPVKQILRQTARMWMMEQCARGAALIVSAGATALLAVLVLDRLSGTALSVPLMIGLIAAAVAGALVTQFVLIQRRRPNESELAQLLDERTASGDLFASALQFDQQPQRYGWLGDLAVRRAMAQAKQTRPVGRWTLGPRRQWAGFAGAMIVLAGVYLALGGFEGEPAESMQTVATAAPAPRTVVAPRAENPRAPAPAEREPPGPPQPVAADTEPPQEEPVVITPEMIDRYLDQLAGEAIDLSGVTPMRWDQEEVSGEANRQNQGREEKIDPVKLDAGLLRDLEQAKKEETQETEGGVDVAVMGDGGDAAAQGDQGGRDGDGNLADAVSKDPRGEAVRMAQRPGLAGFAIRSAEQSATQQRPEDRPMSVLDFLAAVERSRRESASMPADAAVWEVAPRSSGLRGEAEPGSVVHHETLPEDAESLADSYFERLRQADR